MSNKLHETEQTSPQNQQEGENVGKNAIGLDEGSMKIIVVVMGILLLLGFVGVVGTIVYRVINLSEDDTILVEQSPVYELVQTSDSVAIGNIEVEKPRDSKLKNFVVDNGLIYLHFENNFGVETVKIVRLSDGMVLGGIGFLEAQ